MTFKPVIRIVAAPSDAEGAMAQAAVFGLGSLLSVGSRAVDRMPLGDIDLYRSLHLKIVHACQADLRARWFGGRWYNKLAGDEPDYVKLSGTRLDQVLRLVGLRAPEGVGADGTYALRLDIARQAYETLAERVGE